jgi:hypothetical protein
MAYTFPDTAGQATDGSFTHGEGGLTWAWNGSSWVSIGASSGVAGAVDLNGLNDVVLNSPANGEIIEYNGSAWVNTSAGGATGLTSRTTASATANQLANLGSANIDIAAAKTCALLKIQTSHASWVTLYTDGTSRTNDSTRNETTDPLPGSGVIAEIITSDGATQIITPGIFAWNNDTTPGTTIYAKVYNKSGNTADITVTLHYVQLEA